MPSEALPIREVQVRQLPAEKRRKYHGFANDGLVLGSISSQCRAARLRNPSPGERSQQSRSCSYVSPRAARTLLCEHADRARQSCKLPAKILCGTKGFAYAEALKAAGNSVTLMIYPGLPHGFYTFPQLTSSVKYLQPVLSREHQGKGSLSNIIISPVT